MQTNEIQLHFRLTKTLAQLFIHLMEEKTITARQIENDFKIATDGKIAIHRLRRRLEGTSIEIKSMRDVGYWFEPSMKEHIQELVATGQKVFDAPAALKEASAPALV